MLDSNGRLIGVNTMIYSTSGASAGIGFAVPSDTVRRVVNQLIRHGRVIRPSLGITILVRRPLHACGGACEYVHRTLRTWISPYTCRRPA